VAIQEKRNLAGYISIIFSAKRLHIFITIILFIIPFFWLKPGEMDLGGDSSRLFFYDPVSYMLHDVISSVSGNGAGRIEYGLYSQFPHIVLLLVLKYLFHSPYILMSLFNGLKLSVGFIAMYAIFKEIIPKGISSPYAKKLIETSSILGGLFYIFSRHMIANYDKALLYHNQIFLNPLMFYLILKYFLTSNARYMWVALVLSFIFAPSFGYLSAPPLFAFYPLSMIFLFLYVVLVRKKKLPWKGILTGFLIFLGLQMFHVMPLFFDVMFPGSHVYTRLFDKQSLTEQHDYFFGILAIVKPAINVFLPSLTKEFEVFSIVTPLVVIFGFLLNKNRQKTILLTAVFFLITFFLTTGKITWIGAQLYSQLFYVPGFSMFRNFHGVWAYPYSFFYTLLFGQAIFLIFTRLTLRRVVILSLGIVIVILLCAWKLIDGEIVNQINTRSDNVKVPMVMDPKYEETLSFIKTLPTDGRIISFPFTDCCYQVVHGTNNGAYVGPSMIAYLSGKSDFSGYNHTPPFSDTFWELSKAEDYESIKKLLGLFSIKYIFHNKDPLVYDSTFPDYPYSPDYVRKYLPNSQKGYSEFIKNLTTEKIFERGPYGLYEIDQSFFLPHFYIPRQILIYDDDPKLSEYAKAKQFFPGKKSNEIRIIYVERQTCKTPTLKQLCSQITLKSTLPKITFEKINKTKYRIKIEGAKDPYFLAFLDLYHGHWKLIDPTREGESTLAKVERLLGDIGTNIIGVFRKDVSRKTIVTASYFNADIREGRNTNIFLSASLFESWGKEIIADDRHFKVNGYANAWYITPQDLGGKENYEIIAEVAGQKIFYITLPISILIFIGCLSCGLGAFLNKNKKIVFMNLRTRQSTVLIATFSPWFKGKRLSTNGNVEPMLDFFVPKARKIVLIDQPYPGSDMLMPQIEVYENGSKKKIGSSSKLLYILYPFLKAVNYDETHISFKVRDFLSVIGWSLKDRTTFDYFIGMEAINALAGIVLRRLGRVQKVIYYLFDYSPNRYKQKWFNNLYLWLDRYCAMHADFIWDVSKAYHPARIEAGLNPSKSAPNIHVPIGLHPKQIQRASLTEIEPFSLVFMGTLGLLTGPDMAVRAMPLVLKKFSKSKLHIIGGGESDLNRLKELTKELSIESHVIFHGFISDRVRISEIMKKFAIALAPYPYALGSPRLYGDANKIHAYFAAGLPVISTFVPPTGRDAAKRGAAILVKDNPFDLARGIIQVFSDKRLYKKMRKNAFRLAKGNTWENEFLKAFRKMNKP